MTTCSICEKGKQTGRMIRHQHSGLWERKAPKKTRTFEPNIQTRMLMVQGKRIRITLCTKCLKRIKKQPGWHGFMVPIFVDQKDQRKASPVN